VTVLTIGAGLGALVGEVVGEAVGPAVVGAVLVGLAVGLRLTGHESSQSLQGSGQFGEPSQPSHSARDIAWPSFGLLGHSMSISGSPCWWCGVLAFRP